MSFSWLTLQKTASWIAHHFRYVVLHQYHKWLHRGGGQGWRGATKWQVFPCVYKFNTAKWSLWDPYWVLEITNSSQFDDQALWSNPLASHVMNSSWMDSCPLSSQTTAIWRPPKHSSMSDRLEKQAPGKANQGTTGNDTHTDC